MPKMKFDGLPFPPLVKLDTDDPVKAEMLSELLKDRHSGASICVRSATGHINRGGYFFHVRPHDATLARWDIFNFEKIYVADLPLNELTTFINHCSGLAFDEAAFQLCQTVINFRLDPEPLGEAEEAEDLAGDESGA